MLKLISFTLLFCTLLSGAALTGFAQTNPEKYADYINTADLQKHLTIVAGSRMEGRETATRGQRRAARYLIRQFKKTGLQPGNGTSYEQLFSLTKDASNRVRLDTALYTGRTKKSLTSSNILAVIEGSDKKDEYVFLTAHYDHIGKKGKTINYGADDDGSGTVALLEMAQAFQKAKEEGNGPRRTIVFMAVSGEEKGLWGSRYYSDHPIFPLENTTVDLNTDMIGRIDPKRKHGDSLNYIYIIGDNKLSSDLKPISEATNKKYTNLELDYKYNAPNDPERIYYRSDHYNFARKGVPVIFYFNGTHADYHRPTDTIDKINFNLLEKRARLIFHTAWEMANREEMLKRDIPL